ncbi:hypothetical protein N9478_00130 [Gammaproteobacteria bacterium]|nr:hypothetical protein [Gammaproteobacteria bacterium]
MNETLLEILDKKEWKIGFASWIFAGYSPLQKKKNGLIIRLADEEKIPFGSIEFRAAEKAKNEIKNHLALRIIASRGITQIEDSERFERNWLIDIVTRVYNAEGNLDVWWSYWACKKHYLPAYLVPGAISEQERKDRGSFSWCTPSNSDDIQDPKNPSSDDFDVETYGSDAKLKSDGGEVATLFRQRKDAGPTENPTDQKYELYSFFHQIVMEQITVVPEKQAEIEGVAKHGSPLLSTTKARDLIIKAAKERDYIAKYWSVWLSKKGGVLQWQKKNVRDDFVETHELSPIALKSRIDDWFQKTDAGNEYDKFFKISKRHFFKPRSK